MGVAARIFAPRPAPCSQAARGLSRGTIYDRSGRLVASVAQEALMREVHPPA